MESTGVYWVQVYRRLEGFFEVVVANAQHIKAVRGAKNGCAGRRMDCGLVAAWALNGELCAQKGGNKMCGT
jgi:transposase